MVDKERAGFDSLENLQWAEASLVLAEKGAGVGQGVGGLVARNAHVSRDPVEVDVVRGSGLGDDGADCCDEGDVG